MAPRWYVIQTYTGQETKVAQYIQEFIDSGELEDQIYRVLTPTQDIFHVKNGKKVKTTRKFFPSYVLVEMELNKETEHFIRNVNGVSGFVGGKKPQPVREEEIRRILGQAEKTTKQEISEVPFQIGDAVKIKEGPFKDFDGTVDEIHPEKAKVKVMVSVFGRSTPVEVDFAHVNPIG
ncbi:MAG: transcription termination/antitermination factor NusG [Chitinivibrionales bacterium]|nr:transcription termination/antitermination factor NusG [Chitinivibrionales bacterium]MBD3356195.1 transcription termination/antitermination factor NusG [Chitinivibrionales bacterium]